MEKINEITQDQFEKLKKATNQVKFFKKVANIQEAEKYCIGDTCVKVSNSKKFDVFKDVFNNKNFYYIIVNPIDEEQAFAWSLYPRN